LNITNDSEADSKISMYLLETENLLYGDIIFTRTSKKSSNLICKFTKSNFSHARMYVGNNSYIHSDLDGVHSANTQRLLIEQESFAKVVRVDDRLIVDKAIEFARLQVGTSYSRLGAANAGLKLIPNYKTSKQFCSRLVAQAYEYAGLKIVEDSTSCLPEEILSSISVRVIENCLKLATTEERDFALSYDPIKKQSEITNDILIQLKKIFGSKIESLADVTTALIKEPQLDQIVTDIYINSGYLSMWKYEVDKNQWRYNTEQFLALPINVDEQLELALQELKLANEMLPLYKNNFEQYFYIYQMYRLKFAEQHFLLYKQLVSNVLDQKFTMESVLKI
jgi:uncharacterized protein YycO